MDITYRYKLTNGRPKLNYIINEIVHFTYYQLQKCLYIKLHWIGITVRTDLLFIY